MPVEPWTVRISSVIDQDQARTGDGRDETELERYDRNLTELMGELRVALPGVQVLSDISPPPAVAATRRRRASFAVRPR